MAQSLRSFGGKRIHNRGASHTGPFEDVGGVFDGAVHGKLLRQIRNVRVVLMFVDDQAAIHSAVPTDINNIEFDSTAVQMEAFLQIFTQVRTAHFFLPHIGHA
jgi:hypothetical protein